jgi:hypothetical protein
MRGEQLSTRVSGEHAEARVLGRSMIGGKCELPKEQVSRSARSSGTNGGTIAGSLESPSLDDILCVVYGDTGGSNKVA